MNSKPLSLEVQDVEQLKKFRTQDPEKVSMRGDGRDARISKTVRMRLRYSEMLRDESYRRTVAEGQKVSEADLLDEALADWQLKHQLRSD